MAATRLAALELLGRLLAPLSAFWSARGLVGPARFTAAGRRDGPVIESRAVCQRLFGLHLLLEPLLLGPASLPAVLPIADEELEAEAVDFHARLEADAEIAVVHFVLIYIRVEKVQMACDREEEIVIVRGKLRELIFQHLRDRSCAKNKKE